MFTSQELRDEAVRLISLKQDGLEIETVALALRIGDSSVNAGQVLHDLDVRTLESMFNGGTQVRDGQTDVRDTE